MQKLINDIIESYIEEMKTQYKQLVEEHEDKEDFEEVINNFLSYYENILENIS